MPDRVVVDWGSSNFRAFRFGAGGEVVERHRAPAGILSVNDGRFEEVLGREIGPWLTDGCDVYLSGMITSRNGWVETPYLTCPASLDGIALQAVRRELAGGVRLHFMPGVSATEPSPDVMRGEEMQVFGAIGDGEDATIVLPGTHSKWVSVAGGTITGLRTFLTGELFALLSQHSIIGRLMPKEAAPFDRAAFLAGVDLAFSAGSVGLLNDVFTARSGALLDVFPVEAVASRLSGMLIGHELAGGLRLRAGHGDRLVLVGESQLVSRYAEALAHRGQSVEIGPEDAAVEGFRKLVERQAAGARS